MNAYLRNRTWSAPWSLTENLRLGTDSLGLYPHTC